MPIRKRGDRWQVRLSISGQRIERTLPRGATRADARAAEAQLLREATDRAVGRETRRTFDAALLRWLDTEARTLKSRQTLLYRCQAMQPHTKGRYLSDASEIAAAVIRAGHDDGLAPASINRYLAIIKRVTRRAMAWSWAERDHGASIELLPEHNARHVYLTPAEVAHLADHAEGQARAAILLAALTGLRRGELLGLTPDHIRDGCIRLDARTKTSRPRLVPLTAEALMIAQDALPWRLDVWMLRRAFEAARQAAGMPHVHFHDLRHTYASWLIQAGAGLPAVQRLLGHTTLQMTGRYAHLEDEHARKATAMLPSIDATGQKRVRKRREKTKKTA